MVHHHQWWRYLTFKISIDIASHFGAFDPACHDACDWEQIINYVFSFQLFRFQSSKFLSGCLLPNTAFEPNGKFFGILHAVKIDLQKISANQFNEFSGLKFPCRQLKAQFRREKRIMQKCIANERITLGVAMLFRLIFFVAALLSERKFGTLFFIWSFLRVFPNAQYQLHTALQSSPQLVQHEQRQCACILNDS